MTQTALNREQVLAIEPGQELDALVARKVMGWHKGDSWGGAHWVGEDKCYRHEVAQFKPSQHIYAAWDVINFMADDEWDVTIELKGFKHDKKSYECYFGCTDSVKAATAPEAICKAALLAVLDL